MSIESHFAPTYHINDIQNQYIELSGYVSKQLIFLKSQGVDITDNIKRRFDNLLEEFRSGGLRISYSNCQFNIERLTQTLIQEKQDDLQAKAKLVEENISSDLVA